MAQMNICPRCGNNHPPTKLYCPEPMPGYQSQNGPNSSPPPPTSTDPLPAPAISPADALKLIELTLALMVFQNQNGMQSSDFSNTVKRVKSMFTELQTPNGMEQSSESSSKLPASDPQPAQDLKGSETDTVKGVPLGDALQAQYKLEEELLTHLMIPFHKAHYLLDFLNLVEHLANPMNILNLKGLQSALRESISRL